VDALAKPFCRGYLGTEGGGSKSGSLQTTDPVESNVPGRDPRFCIWVSAEPVAPIFGDFVFLSLDRSDEVHPANRWGTTRHLWRSIATCPNVHTTVANRRVADQGDADAFIGQIKTLIERIATEEMRLVIGAVACSADNAYASPFPSLVRTSTPRTRVQVLPTERCHGHPYGRQELPVTNPR